MIYPDRFAARLRRIIRESRQLVIDIEYWNGINPNETPIDCEADRLIVVKARVALAAIEAGGKRLVQSSSDDLADYARSSLGEIEV